MSKPAAPRSSSAYSSSSTPRAEDVSRRSFREKPSTHRRNPPSGFWQLVGYHIVLRSILLRCTYPLNNESAPTRGSVDRCKSYQEYSEYVYMSTCVSLQQRRLRTAQQGIVVETSPVCFTASSVCVSCSETHTHALFGNKKARAVAVAAVGGGGLRYPWVPDFSQTANRSAVP